MRNIWRCLAILMTVVSFVSCDKKDDGVNSDQLSVNYKTVQAVWQLDKIDGAELSDATYFYIELTQKEQEYVIYENLDSSFANYDKGVFFVDLLEYGTHYQITGTKPFHFQESWSESYHITSLTKSTMVWEGVNYGEELTFKRGADIKIPEEVLNGTKAAL